MEYTYIKLISGEEIIGKIDTIDDQVCTVERPATISYGYNNQGIYGIKLSMFMGQSEESLFSFLQKFIMIRGKPNLDLIDFYQSYVKNIDSLKQNDLNQETFH